MHPDSVDGQLCYVWLVCTLCLNVRLSFWMTCNIVGSLEGKGREETQEASIFMGTGQV